MPRCCIGFTETDKANSGNEGQSESMAHSESYWRGLAGTNQELVKASAGGLDRVRQERMALQVPEQTPEGPVPAHVPPPRSRLNLPVPWAMRGPATAFSLAWAETRQPN